jgi:hypothetical protein
MNLPNKLPELDPYLTDCANVIYYLQKIIKYDEGRTESFIIGVWDSPDGDIDKEAQNVIRQEKEFRKYNKFVKPRTMTIRKVKTTIYSKVIESQSEHYGTDYKLKCFKCANCDDNINYGDDLIVKHYVAFDRYFCCSDCLAEYEDAAKYSPDDNEYDKLFIENT